MKSLESLLAWGCPATAPQDETCISDAPQSKALLHCGGKDIRSPPLSTQGSSAESSPSG
ncbi:hypothetical protein F7725_022782 [Dissostichus mawsoni]|uniref:Uncharacterized protein n=1 Tax=Dissostichus mawsoni TaxID=36200 RepID=A0A7J5Z1T2_DISMA|nr:hypothetical protein F7725_022782 [Dissostichus mawsoni]